jgi:hypothetical protein
MMIISMTALTFNCPMCKNQMKQINFGKGRPNIKLQFDMGDGTAGTINTSFMFCNVCNNLQFFVPAGRQMSSPGYLRSRIYSIDVYIIHQVLIMLYLLSDNSQY